MRTIVGFPNTSFDEYAHSQSEDWSTCMVPIRDPIKSFVSMLRWISMVSVRILHSGASVMDTFSQFCTKILAA